MFSLEYKVFFPQNAIIKNTHEKISYLPKAGTIRRIILFPVEYSASLLRG
jgi:hypothetical protein